MENRDEEHIYQEFILLCLRSIWLSDDSLGRARELTYSARWDWGAAIDVAQRERVTPLLYDILRNQDWPAQQALQRLQQHYLFTAARSMHLLRELEIILNHLGAAGICSLVFKGVALGESVYNNVALRSVGDLDVLVRPDQAQQVIEILGTLGYCSAYPEMRARDLVTDKKEVALAKSAPAGRFMVDLHWRLLPDYVRGGDAATQWFWDTSEPLIVGSEETRMLGQDARMVYLPTHCGLSHHWSGSFTQLLWHMDIAMILWRSSKDLNWDSILDRAREYGLARPVKDVVLHLGDDWSVPVDAGVMNRLRSLSTTEHEDQTYELLHTDAPRRAHPSFFITLAQLPSWRARLRYLVNFAVPSAAYMRRRYDVHDVLLPFAYAYRWLTGMRSLVIVAWLELRRRAG